MKGAALLASALVLAGSLPGEAREAACAAEIGAARAAKLVRQCRDVSPGTRPPCHAANRCALISSEIRRGCGRLGADAPDFCGLYESEAIDGEADDGDDDDEG